MSIWNMRETQPARHDCHGRDANEDLLIQAYTKREDHASVDLRKADS